MVQLEKLAYIITKSCNLSCHGCTNFSNHYYKTVDHKPNWRSDLDSVKSFNIDKFYIVGGEPLLINDIYDVIEYAFTFSKKVQLVTNGLLLYKNVNLIDIVKKYYPNFDIYVSYHQSEQLMGKSLYDKMLFESLGKFLNNDSKFLLDRVLKNNHNYYEFGMPIGQQVNIGITYKDWRYSELDIDDVPVPFNSNYIKAYMEQCICPVPHLYKGQIYKCHYTALLPELLQRYNKYDDRWNKLKEYTPNIENLTKPEPVCSICPDNNSQWNRDKTDKYSKIINKPYINQ